jgi:ADP-ribose pyrophosphatase YjhB (NUDIX family)
MPISPYYRGLRERLGTQLLLIPAVAAVVRDERGRVLVQRTHSGAWSLPAGAIEPGEAPAQAVAREVYEETGLVVRAERVLGVAGGPSCRVTYDNGDCVGYMVTLFACERVGGEMNTDTAAPADLCWFEVGAMPPLAGPYPTDVFADGRERAFFEWRQEWSQPCKG